jgi:hypothetical protein
MGLLSFLVVFSCTMAILLGAIASGLKMAGFDQLAWHTYFAAVVLIATSIVALAWFGNEESSIQ